LTIPLSGNILRAIHRRVRWRSAVPSVTSRTRRRRPVRELVTGSTFAGRYQVIEELGRGGMGRVYKVFDTDVKEKVALKLLKPEIAADGETTERFSNELRFARKVSHRNVCRMFDLGKAEGASYITMEFVPGEDLKSLIRKVGQMLSPGKTIFVAKQICEGWPKPTAWASSTATSSPRTSWSTRRATPGSWTSASPARSRARG
jgi:serine/threonine protein kinase